MNSLPSDCPKCSCITIQNKGTRWECEDCAYSWPKEDKEQAVKKLFVMVYQWGRVGVIVDHTAPAFQRQLDEVTELSSAFPFGPTYDFLYNNHKDILHELEDHIDEYRGETK